MTEQQIPKLVGALVEHQSGFVPLSTEDAQWAIQNTKEAISLCVEAIRSWRTVAVSGTIFPRQLWEEVYRGLGIKIDLDALWVEPAAGFWDLYLHPTLTPNRLVKYLKRLGVTVYQYIDDLDSDVRDMPEQSKVPYRVRYHAQVEADEETKNLSAEDTKERELDCITLTHRLLMEVLYFKVAGEHLDENSLTRCDGSRFSGGSVPGVGWGRGGRRVYVSDCSSAYRDPLWRTRVAVPPTP